jgi:hypothetical protein
MAEVREQLGVGHGIGRARRAAKTALQRLRQGIGHARAGLYSGTV